MNNLDNREKKILILGAGTMGLQIALQCATHGFNVSVYDAFEQALEKGEKQISKLAENLAAQKRVDSEQAKAALGYINFSSDPESAGADAYLISESVPEDPELKQKVFAQFNKICPAHTIFTTNSSTLVPSMIAAGTGRADRFIALHFHDLFLTNIVDVMPHPKTSQQTLDKVLQFCKEIDQFPIELKKEQHGYVFNTMLLELLASALTLASKEVASIEDIDRSWMGIMKTKRGPFGIMDSIGIETVYKVTDYWAGITRNPQSIANAAFLKKYITEGALGVKSGKGFYNYPDPDFLKPEFMTGIH